MSLYSATGSVDGDLPAQQLQQLLEEAASRSKPRAFPGRRTDEIRLAILRRPAQRCVTGIGYAFADASGSD